MVPKKDVYRVGGRHGVDESRAARSLAQPLPPIDGIKYLAPRAHNAKIQDLQGLVVVYVLAAAGMHGPFAFTRPPPRSIRLGSGPELLVRSLFPPHLQPDRVHHQCRDRCLWSRIYIYRPVHSIACLFPYTA